MHFEKEPRPTPYLNRRDQYRMLGMLVLLMLIVLAIDATGRPENWRWFFALNGDPQPNGLKELRLDDIDYQVKPDEPLPPDTFLAVSEDETNAAAGTVEKSDDPPGDVPAELLFGVGDQRMGLLRTEDAPLKAVLNRVEAHSPEALLNAAQAEVGYRVVNVEPEKFRGKLLRLEGILWRLAPFPYGDPSTADDDLYQAWVFTSDSANNPWIVLLPKQPEGIEPGDRIERPVTVAGYFFKRYGYATEQGPYVAPLLIARTLHVPAPEAAASARTENITIYVLGFLGAVVLIFGGMVLWFVQGDRKFAKSRSARIAERRLDAPPEVVATMNALPTVDPLDMLKTIESK